MKCVICKNDETQNGTATVVLERDNLTMVIKHVPAQVCSNCGEEYIDEQVVSELFRSAKELLSAGAQVEIREYQAA